MKKLIILLITTMIVSTSYANSDSTKNEEKNRIPLVLEYSFLDFPFATYAGKTVNSTVADPNAKVNLFKGMHYKSMNQATQISNGITQSVHWGVKQIPIFKKHRIIQKLTHNAIAGVYDIIATTNVPYTSGWAHEEFHSSVMVTNYTNSFNPLGFEKRDGTIGEGFAAVAFVLDTNLVMMKKNDNPSFVRLASAGMEAQVYGNEKLQQQNFFYNQDLPHSVHYFLNFFNVSMYIFAGLDPGTDEMIEEMVADEGSNQNLRDFTGLDPLAWCYDLNNPNEPYSARGLNPNGNGYDRYIRTTDLTDEQVKWTGKQVAKSLLNLVSPMTVFINSIKLKTYEDGSMLRGNFSLRYYPTSFGNTIGLDLFIKTPKYNLFVSPHLNQNRDKSFPGIEAMLFEYPVEVLGQKLLTTVDVIADLQPASQSFFTTKSKFAGYINASARWKATKILYPFIGISGKTYGWVKGDPFLKSRIGFELGLSARLNSGI